VIAKGSKAFPEWRIFQLKLNVSSSIECDSVSEENEISECVIPKIENEILGAYPNLIR